eukprot:12934002-Alexandrium_andersonii.AAC.1
MWSSPVPVGTRSLCHHHSRAACVVLCDARACTRLLVIFARGDARRLGKATPLACARLVSITPVLQAGGCAMYARARDSLPALSGAASMMVRVHLQAHAFLAASLRVGMCYISPFSMRLRTDLW